MSKKAKFGVLIVQGFLRVISSIYMAQHAIITKIIGLSFALSNLLREKGIKSVVPGDIIIIMTKNQPLIVFKVYLIVAENILDKLV